MEGVEMTDLGPRRPRRPVHDPEIAAGRPLQARPRIPPEVAVLVDAFGDERMRELEEQRARAWREEQHGFAVDRPGDAAWSVQPVGVALIRDCLVHETYDTGDAPPACFHALELRRHDR